MVTEGHDRITSNVEKNLTARKSVPYYHCSRKSMLRQCFATLVDSMSFLSLDFLLTSPTVDIPNVPNAESGLSLNYDQVSWFESLPFGAFLGEFLQNYIGRRHGLILTNVSTISAWTLLYEPRGAEMLYMSSILLSFSIGLSEAPSINYVCEITTPKLRGTLTMFHNTSLNVGIMLVFFLAAFMSWRMSSLVYIGWSVFSILMLVFVSAYTAVLTAEWNLTTDHSPHWPKKLKENFEKEYADGMLPSGIRAKIGFSEDMMLAPNYKFTGKLRINEDYMNMPKEKWLYILRENSDDPAVEKIRHFLKRENIT